MAKKRVYKQALANLQEAFKLIKNRKNWVQGTYYETDGEGNRVQFCALGASNHVDGKGEERAASLLDRAAFELFPKLFEGRQFGSVVTINDDPNVRPRTAHARVLKVFKRAIQLAQGA